MEGRASVRERRLLILDRFASRLSPDISPRTSGEDKFQVGATVVVKDLKSKTELNGKVGTLQEKNHRALDYEVQVRWKFEGATSSHLSPQVESRNGASRARLEV